MSTYLKNKISRFKPHSVIIVTGKGKLKSKTTMQCEGCSRIFVQKKMGIIRGHHVNLFCLQKIDNTRKFNNRGVILE